MLIRSQRSCRLSVCALALLSAAVEGVPTLRGHDHTGIAVPTMKQGLDFFVGIMGCKGAMSFGPFSNDKGTFMEDKLNVNPRAVSTGSNIELFAYSSADQKTDLPKNSDVGGYQIAFYVDDVKKAAAYLQTKGRAHAGRPAAGDPRSASGSDDPLFPDARGECNASSSATPRAWPMRRPPGSNSGRPPMRQSDPRR